MTALELIARLRELGIRIAARDGELEVDAPRGALDAELRAELLSRKSELLRLLAWSRRAGSDVPLEPVAREQKLPLSWAQQRLWFLDQLEPASSAYNISWTVRLRGELDYAALQAALDQLTARHETLRTVFPDDSGEPYQQILAQFSMPLQRESLPGVGDEQLRARLGQIAAEPFNLAAGPLWRVILLRLADDEHILLVVIHHIIADGASMRVLFRELAACYDAVGSGAPASLPELPVQYADYSVWQRKWLDSAELERQTAYWREQLQGLPPLLELPSDRPRSAAMRYRGASVLRVLPAQLAEELRTLGRARGCTLFMVMLAAFYVLLQRYAGRDDLAVGTPMGGRPRTGLEGLIGFFINTVVLRTDLGGDPSFEQLLHQVREVALGAHANQELPFEKLVEVLQPQRELSYSPVFQVMFDLQEERRWRLPVRNLEVIPEVVFSSRTSSFDLTLSVRQAESGLDAMFEYDTDLFDEHSIEQLASHYEHLLEEIVANPDMHLSQYELIARAEQQRIVSTWGGAAADYPATLTLQALIEARVQLQPDAPALRAGDILYSAAELNRCANRLAHRLQALGVATGQPVAILAARQAETFIAMLAVLKAGGCVLPLDPAWPAARMHALLGAAGARLLLLPATVDLLQADWPPDLRALVVDRKVLTAADYSAMNPVSLAEPDSAAFLMYTSGTSGQPKGVALPHRGLVNYLYQLIAKTGLAANDRVLQFASLSFDICIEETFAAWISGATLVLREPDMHLSVDEFLAGCERYGISWISLPTAWWHELCSGMERDGLCWPAAVRSVLIGGEKARRDALLRWRKVAGDIRLFNTYGPTETSIVATWCELTNLDVDKAGELPIGHPVPNVHAWVLDRNMRPLPAGVPGELYIGGVGVAPGYWPSPDLSPDLSAERFFPDPFANDSGARLYRTGDRARYLADGRLMYLGRVDAQLKIRGYRIEPGEIEAVLNTLAGVEGSAVTAWADPAEADAQPRLVAYVVGAVDADALRGELQLLLPDYMLPAALLRIERLPLTLNGKLDYRALPRPAWSREHSEPSVLPRNATERTVAAIWAEVLGLSQVGVFDNFFALGGHSLLATRVVSRVRDALHSRVPLRRLFDAPTVAGFAAALDSCKVTDDLLPLTRRPRDNALLPLSWTQQRLWVLDQLELHGAAYQLPWTATLTGPLDSKALQAAVNAVVTRHESLRTSFRMLAGEPVQLVETGAQVQLQSENCPASREQIAARLRALIAVPFDLHQGPLLRVHLLRTGKAQHVLLLLLHHIIADGWSMGVLFRELAFFYNCRLQRRTDKLPELPVQYADYALWQRQWLAGAELDRQATYWRVQLAGVPPLLELPLDLPRPPVQSYRGAWVNAVLSPAVLGELRVLATTEGASLFMVLLAAFKALLAVHAGSTDIVVGTPVAGRQRTELEGLIGCFLNTLVLRTRLDGNPAFSKLLADVRQTTLDAYEHQDLPFEKLLDILQPERSTAWTPVVQVLFNLHNAATARLEFDGIDIEAFDVDRGTAKFDLSAALVERADGLHIGFEYNVDLFAPLTLQAMLDDYVKMLHAVAHDPQISLRDLVRTRTPRIPLPQHTFTPWPEQALQGSVAERFAAMVAQFPERLASSDGVHHWTYRELDRRVSAVAQQVQRATAGARVTVGLMLGHDAPMLAGLLGVLRAGCAYVPLDRHGPVVRNRTIAADADLGLLLSDPRFVVAAQSVAAGLCPLLIVDADQQPVADSASAVELPGAAPDDLAYILFTSGSTGTPKGVMQTQRNLLHHVHTYSQALRIGPQDYLTLLPNYGFDAALMDIYGALLNGASLRSMDVLAAAGPEELLATLSSERLTVLHTTPTVLRYLLARDHDQPQDLGAIRAVVLGGEEATARDFELFRAWFAEHALLINGLGPSESTTALQFFANHRTLLPGHVVPVGLPVAGTTVRVLDRAGQPAAIVGELCICSAFVSIGYQGQPELSAQRFLPDPDAPGMRMYRSGDRVRYLPDGQLVFMGRIDEQLKLRGQRIEPAEIEAALLGIDGVESCVVVAALTAIEGVAAEATLVAYVQGLADVDELRTLLRAKLPEYMIPAAFMRIDRLPLLPNGKLDRRALPAPVFQRTTELQQAPHGAVEVSLHAIWTEVLGVPACGVHDDFFALGGHSLKATRVVARIRDLLNVHIGLRDLFAHPTLASLAAFIESAAGVADPGPVLLPRTGAELPPLSWAQQRLWFLDQLEPDSAAYNLHWAARLDGGINAGVLQRALEALAARHETLRTTFAPGNGEPVQLVAQHGNVRLQEEALPGADADRLHARLLGLIRQPFDLRAGPLLRAYLLRVADTHSVLLLVMHHIVADGWSMGVLFRELANFYNSALAGRSADLLPLPVQYADYAIWQRAWLSGGELERQESYWRAQLADAPPLLDLPLDHVRPPVQRYRGAWVSDTLPLELLQRLRELAARDNATLFMVLLAAFKVVVFRHSGREDILVGTPIAGRRRTALEGLIGFFLNTLVLRTDLGGNPGFRSALERVRHATLAAYDHQELPFEKLLEIVQPARSMAYTPIVQVMFNLHNEPGNSLQLDAARVTPFNVDRGTAKFDLSVALVEGSDGLQIGFEYNTDLFVRDTVAGLLRHYCEVLAAVVVDADIPIAALPLTSLCAEPRPQNDYEPFPAEQPQDSIAVRFAEIATRYADRPAVVDAAGCWSYSELEQRSSAVARRVADHAAPGSRVGLLLGHDAPMTAGLLGVLKAGCAYVPLDPQAPAARLQAIVDDASVSLIVSCAELRDIAIAAFGDTLTIVEVPAALPVDEGAGELLGAANALAYILFTSGSTGKPKGVMQTHRNVLQHIRTYSNALRISVHDRLTLFSGYGFDAAVMDIFGALLNGACLYPVDIRNHAHPGELLDRLGAAAADDPQDRREGVTILHATPTLFRFLMRHKVCRHDLSAVRLVVLGGEEALAADFALFRRHFAPPALFVNGLGPSECTLALQFFADHATRLAGQIVPVGLPVAATEIDILNEDGTSAGICGELAIRSPYVSTGYWNQPELTRQRFLPIEDNGQMLYRTGDRVRRLPDGRLAYLGRMDAQIKVRGHRVEPGEIEAQLAALDGIDRCAVVLRSDSLDSRQVEARLVAYIVTGDNDAQRALDRAELRRHLQAVLPEYMVPQAFVWLDELPLLANGKIDRRALPPPDWGRDESRVFVAPRTATERQLASIWADILGVTQVSVHDDFFDLGGHSLMAAQFVARVTDSLQVGLPLRRLFDAPTIASLAEHVDTLQWALHNQPLSRDS